MTTNNQHTTGPWQAVKGGSNLRVDDEEQDRRYGIYAPNDEGRGGSWVAVVEGDVFPEDEQEANARLIAAAPELLEAAKIGLQWMTWWHNSNDCDCENGHTCGLIEQRENIRKIEAAITKATNPQ